MVSYQEPNWVTVADSPTVIAARELLMRLNERIAEVTGTINFEEPLDVRRYVRWDSAPLENIKEFLEFLDLPSGDFLGEEFERRVYRDLFELFQGRNYRAGLTVLEREASAAIQHWWDYSNGIKTHLHICVSPSPLVNPVTQTYATGMSQWCRWMIEWWAEDMTVILCSTQVIETISQLSVRVLVRPPIAHFIVE